MNDGALPVICRGCTRKFRLDQILFDDVRKAYVCRDCFNKSRVVISSNKNPLVVAAEKSISDLRNSLVKFTCNKCNYHFERQNGKDVKSCPYCGSVKISVLDKDVSNLINDS